VAWVPPTQGSYSCERCGRTAEEPEGWLQIEIREAGEETVTHDFCALCKIKVRRTFKTLAPKAPAGS
jgi:hypothetical protein